MTEIESIELARTYVARSNAHRVDLIQPLFAADAIYRSSAVGIAGEFDEALARRGIESVGLFALSN